MKNVLKKIIKIFIIMIISSIILFTFTNIYARILPKLDISNVNSFYLYDINNNLFFQGSEHNKWVTLDNINKYVIDATINIEDRNFYNHFGFDIKRIIGAFIKNIRKNKIVEGASTITQQYAKNLYLDFDKTFKRKISEVWYTIRIESHYDKNTILEGYLNTINYGHGMYGIENASLFYFNKKASELDLAEASMLVSIPKSPTNYSPINNYEKAKKRQVYVLNTLLKNKIITKNEYDEALKKEIIIYGKKENINLKTIYYYQDAVFRELKTLKGIPKTYLDTGGIKIYTNLNIDAQSNLENNINKVIDNNEIEVNSIMMEPYTGKIIALTGGRDYNKSEYNRTISSKRQVGSIMKSILYYSAIENGFNPSTKFLSEKTTFNTKNGPYTPKNYNNIYGNKEISLAAAIAYSDNVYAVKTHLFLGEDSLVETAYKMGIKTKLESIPSLPLGTIELGIIEVSNAYLTLASEGIKVEPYLINKIEDTNGNTLYTYKEKKETVLDKTNTYILNELLTLTSSYDLIDYNYPTNININALLKNKYASKSGSTETDSWTIGFNKNILTSVWIGYDDNRKMNEKDYRYAKKIWAYTVENYNNDKDNTWYSKPENVIGVLVNPITGTIETNKNQKKKILYYKSGSEPLINE